MNQKNQKTMTPLELKELLSEIKSEIPEINTAKTVVDDADITRFVGDLNTDHNMVLIGAIPSYSHKGKISAFQMLPVFTLFVMEKCDYSSISNDEYIVLLDRTFAVMVKVRDFLLEKIEDGCYELLNGLDVTAMEIDPAKHKADLNGWSMDIITE